MVEGHHLNVTHYFKITGLLFYVEKNPRLKVLLEPRSPYYSTFMRIWVINSIANLPVRMYVHCSPMRNWRKRFTNFSREKIAFLLKKCSNKERFRLLKRRETVLFC